MIAATAFVIIFLAVALTVLFVAFGGGVGGARERLHSQTPIGRRVAFAGITAVTVLFGAAIPFVLVDHNKDSQARESVGGVKLNDGQAEGRALFARYCSTCHTLKGANAVGKVGPDLDLLRPPKALVLDAIAKGRARGSGQMPTELLTGKDAEDVAEFVEAVAGR